MKVATVTMKREISVELSGGRFIRASAASTKRTDIFATFALCYYV